ncbi:hypothetical protein [Roseospira goensis]|uniref:Uncharacterized protein n=1 Tax=Roseospira goensis TaxID=391922 RepID=A0A7W6WLP3_9PROT|nr:hypothetical protein [Roseospira goensis]MBB4287611.1 hypothetical protein [Roseospira goensis]
MRQAPSAPPQRRERSPEELRLYDQTLDAMRQVLYDEGVFQAVKAGVEAAPDPALGLIEPIAQAAVRVLVSAREAGQPVTQDMMFAALVDTTREAVEAVEEIRGRAMTEEQATNAFLEIVTRYADLAGRAGLIDPQEAEARMAGMEGGPMPGAAAPQPPNRAARRAGRSRRRRRKGPPPQQQMTEAV